jgi:hypothetical protein
MDLVGGFRPCPVSSGAQSYRELQGESDVKGVPRS